MTPLKNGGIDESYGLLSPRGTSFELHVPEQSQNFGTQPPSFEPADVSSPIKTQFPKDVFDSADDTTEPEVLSPRAEEFHMSPSADPNRRNVSAHMSFAYRPLPKPTKYCRTASDLGL